MTPKKRGRAKGAAAPAVVNFRVLTRAEVKKTVASANVPRTLKARFADTVEALGAHGCREAGYRLSGEGEWPKLCAVDLGAGYRLVLAFRTAEEIVLLEIGVHDNRSNPYVRVAEILDLPPTVGHGGGAANRLGCCDEEGNPRPVDELGEVIDALIRSR